MSDKRPQPVVTRVLGGLLIGGLLTTLVVVYADRRNRGHSTAPLPPVTATTSVGPPTALQGNFDVTLTATAVEYGSTWTSANPQIAVGQAVTQRWSIDCRSSICVINITTGHIAEDPDGATVASTDGRTFAVSGTRPATSDDPALPAGCGAVNAIDSQQLTLTAASGGTSFSGRYAVHHPTIHVEGPVAIGTASCDSFNAVFDITGRRR
ncbi:MAG: hypothetical protein QOC92_275 [Acidimicrobiaceae bacterium]|jgi:hypothetical protein